LAPPDAAGAEPGRGLKERNAMAGSPIYQCRVGPMGPMGLGAAVNRAAAATS
jgi:hypothetical protein